MLYKLDLKHGTVNANSLAYTGNKDILQTVNTTYLDFKSMIVCTITVSRGLEWEKSFDRNVIAKT